jgi:nicotinate phosphoribosyltransferase
VAEGVVKVSAEKHTWPGSKQVWRHFDGDSMTRDIVAAADEPASPGARPLLVQVMAGGRRARAAEALSAARERCRAGVGALRPELRALERASAYPVQISAELESRRAKIAAMHTHADSKA